MILDVTITTTMRPELLFKTLYSFSYNLLGKHHCRAIVNVDPIGPCKDQNRVRRVIQEFFGNRYLIAFSEVPHFPSAFKRIWDKVESDWVFHLEDDWELKKEVDLLDMVKILEKYKNLAALRLPQFKSTETSMKNWNLIFPWNGDYFECPEENKVGGGFCGHPSLIKGTFVKACRIHLNTTKNPEKQFHSANPELNRIHQQWDYGVYGKPNEDPYVVDIGREWMIQHGYQKKGNKAWFQEWEKKEEK